MKKAKPNRDTDGRIYADSDGGWYYLTEILNNGNEKRIVSSNALFHVQESATRYSLGDKNFKITLGDVLLVDGRTHQAIAFYKKNEGLQEDWREEDSFRAEQRRRAYENGQRIIVVAKN